MDWSSVFDDAPHKVESLAHALHSACLTAHPTTPYDPYPAAIPRLARSQELAHHHGCVNTIHWNPEGSTIVTGSDDRRAGIWRPDGNDIFTLRQSCHSGHSHNIFDAKFVPGQGDEYVVTCAADGELRHFPTEAHPSAAYIVNYRSVDAATRPQMMYHMEFLRHMPMSLLACCQDGTLTQYDLRCRTVYNKLYDSTSENARSRMGVTTFCVHPLEDTTYLIACGDLYARQFDLRKPTECVRKFKPDHFARSSTLRSCSITGLAYSPRGDEFAFSAMNHGVYIVKTNSNQNRVVKETPSGASHSYDMMLGGHRNIDTFLKGVAYLGPDYLSTGSDCGHVFVWSRRTGRVASLMKGDGRVVNMVSPHPYRPLLATCGIDSDAKIFTPSDGNNFSQLTVDLHLESNIAELGEVPYYRDFVVSAMPHMRRVIVPDGCDTHPTFPKDVEPFLTPYGAFEASSEIKTRGNEFYRAGNVEVAVQKYSKALRYVEFAGACPSAAETTEVKVAIMANCALCLLKMKKYAAAAKQCTSVLALDPTHTKSLFRRAQCHMRMGNADEARADVDAALTLAPGDAEIQKLKAEILGEIVASRRFK